MILPYDDDVVEGILGQVKNFFLMWSMLGKVKITRFFVKALCARSARFARSAPRPAEGRPWRALRWDKLLFLLPNMCLSFLECFILKLQNLEK